MSSSPTLKPYADLLARIHVIPAFNGLGVDDITFAEGLCHARIPRQVHLDGIFESYHGGMLATAADTIACFAIMTQTGADSWLTTTDLTIHYLRPCLSDVWVEAKVIKLGRQLCLVDVNLYNNERQHVAVAHVTYMRLKERPLRPS
jgi:uncharacterized protein (TIGR00369 family)